MSIRNKKIVEEATEMSIFEWQILQGIIRVMLRGKEAVKNFTVYKDKTKVQNE